MWFGGSWVHEFLHQDAEGPFCGGRDDPVSEEAQFVGAIVTGDTQLGIVQPTGRFISVSTQRGFSLPHPIALASASGIIDASFSRFPDPPARPVGPPVTPDEAGVGHVVTC
jgi:hypothetical protein